MNIRELPSYEDWVKAHEHRSELERTIRELRTENEKLARALAEAPTPLEERKVAALEKIAEALVNDDELVNIFSRLSRIADVVQRQVMPPV